MAVRGFDGTDDRIKFAVGGVAISNFAQGNYTVFALFKPTTISGTEAIVAVTSEANTDWLSVFCCNGTDQIAMVDEANVYGSSQAGADFATTIWSLAFLRKSSGTNAVEFACCAIGDTTPTFSNTGANTTAGTAGTPDQLEVASSRNGSFSSFKDMRLACAAIWNSRLSDANITAIATAKTTQSVYDLTPLALWDFNQASTGTAVEDLIGTSDQNAITGTSVVNGDDPSGWTFGVTVGQARPYANVKVR